MSAIIETYQNWKQCLSRNLGSQLTKQFVQERLKVLSNASHAETIKFIQLYGAARQQQIVQWFEALNLELEN